jgi:Domain of unknown function (DUF5666)
MRKAVAVFCLVIFCVAIGFGCSSNSFVIESPMGSQPVTPASITIHDNPPAGVTVLSFEITVTGASLQPSDTKQAAVSMIQESKEIELEHLQVESALLANLNVPSGIYNGLSVTFMNPKMTILNQTSAALSLGGGQNCAVGQICEFAPKLNQSMVTVAGPTAPFPISLMANSAVVLDLDFNVDASIQSADLSITPAISLKQVTLPTESDEDQLRFIGRISAIDSTNKTFTLETGFSRESKTIATDASTQFNFDNSCAANDFSCLVVGEIVSVRAHLPTSGSNPLATQVNLFAPEGELALVGLVSKVDVTNKQFQLVIRDLFDQGAEMQSIPAGIQITAQIASQAAFSVNSDGVTLPAGLNFTSVTDLVVGQAVEIHPVPPFVVSGAPPNINVALSTDKVRLEPSPVTAMISAIASSANPPNFTLQTLPMLFTGNGVTAIQVDVLPSTEFANDSTGLAGLGVGNKVSVGGLLFNTSGTPTMVAERVLLRTQ